MPKLTDPVIFYKKMKNALGYFWSLYFQLNDVTVVSSFHVSDLDQFKRLIEGKDLWRRELIFARLGIEYLYLKDGEFVRLSLPFPRAMIFYRAKAIAKRDDIFSIWSDPNFPARETLLVESDEEQAGKPSEIIMSEPAKIVEYKNEKVVIESEAKQDGWLVCWTLLSGLEGDPGRKAGEDLEGGLCFPGSVCKAGQTFAQVLLSAAFFPARALVHDHFFA
jgi:hypothetical protein